MHNSVMTFLHTTMKREEFEGKRVLEVGSLYWDDTPRDVVMPFNPALYIGIDERKGVGVDEVRSADNLNIRFEKEWFDAVICVEVLEHAKNWRLLIQQIKRVLKPGGVLYFSCRAPGYLYHEEPNDYWRFTLWDIHEIFADMKDLSVMSDPEFPGVFCQAFKRGEPHKPVELNRIRPMEMHPPSHHLSLRFKKVEPKIKFTIITPTVLRPSLYKACKRLEGQSYDNWEHIVMIDIPGAPVPTWLKHPKRKIFHCDRAHKNVGNTCRHNAFPHITGDYVLYLDDDNFYHKRSLALLADAIMRAYKEPHWGIFPMIRLRQHFFNVPPGKNMTDTGQFFHRPLIHGQEIKYLAIDDYAADGELVEKLNSICDPLIVDPKIPLINMPVRSFGLVGNKDAFGKCFTVLIPNRFEDVIQPLIDSIKIHERTPYPRIIIIGDNHSRDYGFESLRVDEPFIFSRNVNYGIHKSTPSDVIVINDDIRFIMPTLSVMRDVMLSHPEIGILSPLIDGAVGNKLQSAENIITSPGIRELTYVPCTKDNFICFAMVYLRMEMLLDIGLMDEDFKTYGRDDADLCIRASKAGWKGAIYNRLVVRHGIGGSADLRGKNWNTSFMRRPELLEGEDHFTKKWENKTRV